jgi:hypothetical protein
MSGSNASDPAAEQPDGGSTWPSPPQPASQQPPGPESAPGPPAYPTAPQYGVPEPPAPATPPPPVALAVRLMYVGAALSLLGIVIAPLQRNALRSQLAQTGNLQESQLDAAVAAAVVLAVVGGLVQVGLWVLNAVFNARGRTWARLLSTGLGALAVLSGLTSLVRPAAGLTRAVTLVEVVLAAVIVVLLWRPEATRFYVARSGSPAT